MESDDSSGVDACEDDDDGSGISTQSPATALFHHSFWQ